MRDQFDRERDVTYIGPRTFILGFAAVCAAFLAIIYGATRMTESIEPPVAIDTALTELALASPTAPAMPPRAGDRPSRALVSSALTLHVQSSPSTLVSSSGSAAHVARVSPGPVVATAGVFPTLRPRPVHSIVAPTPVPVVVAPTSVRLISTKLPVAVSVAPASFKLVGTPAPALLTVTPSPVLVTVAPARVSARVAMVTHRLVTSALHSASSVLVLRADAAHRPSSSRGQILARGNARTVMPRGNARTVAPRVGSKPPSRSAVKPLASPRGAVQQTAALLVPFKPSANFSSRRTLDPRTSASGGLVLDPIHPAPLGAP